MGFTSKAASVMGYRVLPVSILASLTYLAIFIALFVTDTLPTVPAPGKQGGLDLNGAYEDLSHITAHPHPYNSHANDRVRHYILSRLTPLYEKYPHVHLSDDLVSNGSWAEPRQGVYFEGTNIIVKIDGTSGRDDGAVLFSAHYDSVSTAPGATDDGMGVATLLQLIQLFAKTPLKKTAIFNINNGEEDWLNGAHAFLEHPWSNFTDTFLNLEGAAAGGRPILFRATSTSPVRAFRNLKLVPHPHANVLSSDAFARGLIPSGTDFEVYAGPGPNAGMAGLDVAFYKGRSRYHTKYDAVQYTLGGKKSLWSMMEVARGVGIGLLEAPFDDQPAVSGVNDDPVYFDLFRAFVVVFPLARLLTFDIVTLIVGPILLILLLVCEKVIFGHRRESEAILESEESPIVPSDIQPPSTEYPHLRYFSRNLSSRSYTDDEHPNPRHALISATHPVFTWLKAIWRHTKFWISLGVAFGLQIFLIWAYVVLNPFAVYSSPYVILLSLSSLAYLTLVFLLTLPSSLPFYKGMIHPTPDHWVLHPALQQKHTIFFHLYAFSWILLVLATLGITQLHPGLGGGYLVSIWSACIGVACILGSIEGLVSSPAWKAKEEPEDLEGEEESADPRRTLRLPEDSNETTPLMWRGQGGDQHRQRIHVHDEEVEGGGIRTWWWIPQFLISVPIPVILFGHVTMLLLDSVPQTLADGASAWSVYILTSLCGVLLIIPLMPFVYKLRPARLLTTLVFLIFLASTLYALIAFPFSVESPLKVYFQQHVAFPEGSVFSHSSKSGDFWAGPNVTTTLTGPQRYIMKKLIPHLPSAQNKPVVCSGDPRKHGLVTCEWESGPRMKPVPGSLKSSRAGEWRQNEFFKANVVWSESRSSARIKVKGRNTRSCRLYFESSPIFHYVVRTEDEDDDMEDAKAIQYVDRFDNEGSNMQAGWNVPPGGINQLRLFSRTWEKGFRADISWSNSTGYDAGHSSSGLRGRIACEWAEYESATVDNGMSLWNGQQVTLPETDDGIKERAKIPALEEVLSFLPDWAVVSKVSDGLVEAYVPFEVGDLFDS